MNQVNQTSLHPKPHTVASLRAAKNPGQPLLALTAYTAPIAQLVDELADIVLVGDSVGMVLYGMQNTLGVTLEMMIAHGRCVAQHSTRALCVVDMPFGSYQASPVQAFDNAARLLQHTGAAAVKLEGGVVMAETIAFLTARGVPVMAHIGLQPQQVQAMGGYKVQGKSAGEISQLQRDGEAVAQAGAFCVVLEGMVETVAAALTKSLTIPTLGIGASPACDGQILVTEDVLGLTAAPKAKFVKTYANLYADGQRALELFAADVRARRFPDAAHVYGK